MAEVADLFRIRFIMDTVNKSFPMELFSYIFSNTPVCQKHEIFNELINPGFNLALQQLEVGFTHRFTGVNASVAGSIGYWWEIRSEAEIVGSGGGLTKLAGAWVNITGTYQKLIGTSLAYEDSFAGRVALGSLPYMPARIRLTARSLAAANAKGEVKNSTYMAFKGIVIPGT